MNADYLSSLKIGDRVVETEPSDMFGATGVVYQYTTQNRVPWVRWDLPGGQMDTSVTQGTRRVVDVVSDLVAAHNALHAALDLRYSADKMADGIALCLNNEQLDQRSAAADAYFIYKAKKERLAKESKT